MRNSKDIEDAKEDARVIRAILQKSATDVVNCNCFNSDEADQIASFLTEEERARVRFVRRFHEPLPEPSRATFGRFVNIDGVEK